jgi:hypothetical protein
MPDTNRNEFKVVVEGIALDDAHKARINAAIQKAVASALLDGGTGASGKELTAAAASGPVWASFGRTNGIVYRPLDAKFAATLKTAGIAVD